MTIEKSSLQQRIVNAREESAATAADVPGAVHDDLESVFTLGGIRTQAHERTMSGIQARLERHGRVQGQGLQWRGRVGDTLAGANDGERSET
jgi:hypothetical protein